MADIPPELQTALDDLAASMKLIAASMHGGADNAQKFSEKLKAAAGETEKERNARENNAKQIAENARLEENRNKATRSSVQAIESFTNALFSGVKGFEKYGNALNQAGDVVLNLSKNLGATGQLFGILVKGATMLGSAQLKQVDNILKASDDLSKMGGTGGTTTEELLNMGLKAGLTSKNLDLMIAPMKSLGNNILALGGNAAAGQKAFADLVAVSKQQRMEFQKLGVTQEELMQHQSDYIALQTMAGRTISTEAKDRAALQKASLDYTENLLVLAQISGEDVNSAKKKQQEASRAVEWQVSQINMESKARKLEAEGRHEAAAAIRAEAANRQKGMDALSVLNEDLAKGAREFVATGTLSSEQAQGLARLGLTDALKEYKKEIAAGGDATKAAAKLNDAFNKKIIESTGKIGFAASRSKDVSQSFLLTEQNLVTANKMRGKSTEEQAAAAKKRIEEQKNTQDKAQNSRAYLTEMERDAAQALEKFLKLINPLMGEFSLLKIAMLGLQGAAILAAGKLAIMAGKKALGGMVGGGGGGAAVAKGGAKGAAGGAGGILGGLGEGTGALLKGAAEGISAFASPKVALGAVGFGVAIAAIGAGIAGATWIIGKALPSLAEGLQSFEKIDGDKLKATGMGILALGGGLAVFGVGGAAAGFGSIVGNLSDGITKAFGGKTPFDKLKEFGELDINTKNVKNNAEAMMAFGKAMASMGAGTTLSGIGTAASAIGDAIGKAFEAEPPIDKMKKFAEIQITPEQVKNIKNNSEAFVAFGNAMSAVGSGTLNTGMGTAIGAIGDAIGSYFKTKPPLERMQDFAKIKITDEQVKSIKRNAEAFTAFANAMASYKGGAEPTLMDSISGAVAKYFEKSSDEVFDKFVKFSKLSIKEPATVKKNADAFVEFSNAMAQFKGTGEFSNAVDNIVGGITKLFGGADVTDKFVKFAKLDVNPDNALKLGQAFAAYASGLNILQGGAAGGAKPAAGGAAAAVAAPAGGAKPAAGGAAAGGAAAGGAAAGGAAAGAASPGAYSAGPTAPGGARPGAPVTGPGKDEVKKYPADGLEQVKKAGLKIRPTGDVYQGGPLTDKAVDVALALQNIPGFQFFTGLNDQYHKDKHPRSQHALGRGIDLTVDPKFQSKEETKKIKGMIASIPGVAQVLNEYYKPPDGEANQYTTGGHFHVNVAKEGGIFDGPDTGYPVMQHGTELTAPLDKDSILMKMAKTAGEIGDLTSLVSEASGTPSDGSNVQDMLREMASNNMQVYGMLADKLDQIIYILNEGNDTSNKLLKYSMV